LATPQQQHSLAREHSASHWQTCRELVARLKTAAVEAGRAEPLVLPYTVDITSAESVRELHQRVTQAFDSGRIDVLVNKAAHMEPVQRLLDSDPETYWRTWEVSVRGLMNMARTFLPSLLQQTPTSNESKNASGHKTMLNLSSSGALSARPFRASYRCSKLALLRAGPSLCN
jgi:NAD(P)-dependent dehydrogenase (short-subunit alcohol dehydrogenase family)